MICEELQAVATKLRQAALVTTSMTPRFCGWIRRSSGFMSKPPRFGSRATARAEGGNTSWGVRSWAVLVQGNLLFMTQPYAGATTGKMTRPILSPQDSSSFSYNMSYQ